jgi:hypothetical protein
MEGNEFISCVRFWLYLCAHSVNTRTQDNPWHEAADHALLRSLTRLQLRLPTRRPDVGADGFIPEPTR